VPPGAGVLTIELGAADLGRVRFAAAPAPLLETVLMLFELRQDLPAQVVRDTGYFADMDGAFEIASGDAIPDTLLILAMDDQTSEVQAQTRKAIALFEDIRSYALSAEESRALIQEAIERWNSQQH
jgi:hypothetical protein